MKYFTNAILLLWLPLVLSGQNLVLNPGFEEANGASSCRFTSKAEQFNESLFGWNTFRNLTPDLITDEESPEDCPFSAPRSGHRMAGVIHYYPAAESGWPEDYHEFIQGSFAQPLQPDKEYELSFWLNRQEAAPRRHLNRYYGSRPKFLALSVAANNFGILFLTQPARPGEDFSNSIRIFNYRPHINIDTIVGTTAGQWVQIRLVFTAPNAARYFVIGNFYPDANAATTKPVRPETIDPTFTKMARVAYYCIDDVYIGPARPALEDVFQKEGRYTFQYVTFATGSDELLPPSYPELDALAGFLKSHPAARALIAGHTDDVGDEAANVALSERRARAVGAYLAGKGIDTTRLSFKGFGESQPIASNDTPEGRQQNRRVECVLE
ncbi:MAG: OmpA family protein [Phaeodactylibacter sp.]|nr:OmpA family protein [Phaeodactylibacter sp.]MCB9299310.1 OmpA family protein [Lewinellaceae bacterium]HQU58026.1 OmpA family protein [Saprospiraceae bacterium]